MRQGEVCTNSAAVEELVPRELVSHLNLSRFSGASPPKLTMAADKNNERRLLAIFPNRISIPNSRTRHTQVWDTHSFEAGKLPTLDPIAWACPTLGCANTMHTSYVTHTHTTHPHAYGLHHEHQTTRAIRHSTLLSLLQQALMQITRDQRATREVRGTSGNVLFCCCPSRGQEKWFGPPEKSLVQRPFGSALRRRRTLASNIDMKEDSSGWPVGWLVGR